MEKPFQSPTERLLRVRSVRMGKPVELLVHYEFTVVDGCETYRLCSIEEVG